MGKSTFRSIRGCYQIGIHRRCFLLDNPLGQSHLQQLLKNVSGEVAS